MIKRFADLFSDVLELGRPKVGYGDFKSSLHLAIRILRKADRSRRRYSLQSCGNVYSIAHQVAVFFLHHVTDVDATAARIAPLGGTIFCPPTDIPNIGRFAVASDPTGGMFAIYMAKR